MDFSKEDKKLTSSCTRNRTIWKKNHIHGEFLIERWASLRERQVSVKERKCKLKTKDVIIKYGSQSKRSRAWRETGSGMCTEWGKIEMYAL